MPKTKNPRRNTASGAMALLKPMMCAALAIAALATIIWLAGASTMSGNRDFPAGSLVEFMHSTASHGDADSISYDLANAPGEWPGTPLPSSGNARPSAVGRGNGNAGRTDFSQPQARRNLLSRRSGSAVPARRNEEFERDAAFEHMPDAGLSAHYVPNSIVPSRISVAASPAVTLALARRMLDGPTAIPARSEAAGEVAGESVAVTRPVPRGARINKGGSISSAEALANVPADYPPLSVDDLFSLKLRGEYGTSEANLKNGGIFEDRFLVLGGEKKFEFAGMDQMKLKMDGVITTGGRWDYPSMEQDLSGIALNAGPEIKFPELPIKLNINLGAGWLKRKATLATDGPLGQAGSKADIDSFVYGGGAAMSSDWQWRMFKITGMAGVQYATSADKEHTFTFTDPNTGMETDAGTREKLTQSAWELPVQLRIGGEYKLLNALSVLPSLWGGYTFNISGKNGSFRNGHIAGAESTWRRHGLTWNRNAYHIGGELRIRAVDRFDLWFAYQKEWAGDESGKYMGGGIQIAF